MTCSILFPDSLSVTGPNAEFVHEGSKSHTGSYSQTPLIAQELPCYSVVMLRAWVCLFPSAGNRERQWEQRKGNGALQLCKKYPRLEA